MKEVICIFVLISILFSNCLYSQQLLIDEKFTDDIVWDHHLADNLNLEFHDSLLQIHSVKEGLGLVFYHKSLSKFKHVRYQDDYDSEEDTLQYFNRSNFIIDYTIRKLSGDNNSFYGIWIFENPLFSPWQQLPAPYLTNKHLCFEINNVGKYRIYISDTIYLPILYNSHTVVLAQGESEFINTLNKQNDISLKTICGKVLLYINDNYINEIDIDTLGFTGDICLYTQNNLNIQLKKFRIYNQVDPKILSGHVNFREDFHDNINNWDEFKESYDGAYIDQDVLRMYSNDGGNESEIVLPYEIVMKEDHDFLFSFNSHITEGNLEIEITDLEEEKLIINMDALGIDSLVLNSKYNNPKVFKSKFRSGTSGWRRVTIRKFSDNIIVKLNNNIVQRFKVNNFEFSRIAFKAKAKIFSTIIFDAKMDIDDILFYQTNYSRSADSYGPTITMSSKFPFDGKIISQCDTLIIQGFVTDESGISDFRINNRKVNIDYNGTFEFPIILHPGDTIITLYAKDFLGNKTIKEEKLNFTKIYQSINPGINKFGGRNFVFVIAIDKYPLPDTLRNCVKDAKNLLQILLSKYKFSNEFVIQLFNSQATSQNIMDTIGKLIRTLGSNDNLILFFSGHGFYDPTFAEGYWIPVDAKKTKTTDYISNTSILKSIKLMRAKNILVISDACFSGSFFTSTKANSYTTEIERYNSRWALTSGRNETVSGSSTFANCIITFLANNAKSSVTISELAQYVKQKIPVKIDQVPRGEPLPAIYGHEGGEFIFYKK